MNISQQLERDHAELHALGRAILKDGDGADVGGRDNEFDYLDLRARRHLAVIEDVLVDPIRKGEQADAAADILKEHKALRAELSALDRPGKGGADWTAEFRHFTDHLERVCHQHERLIGLAQEDEDELGRRYEQAKLARIQGHLSWNKVGIGVAGAAALAGAAFAANRYFRSGRRSAGRGEDDFELRLETDENVRLISSTKVEGTPVVGSDGTKLGTIESFMVDKYTGRVAYAVMRFSGLSGLGKSLFPLPWPLLDYDEAKDGYALDLTAAELANAPRFEANDEPEFTPAYRREILVFYRSGSLSDGNSQATAASDASPTARPTPTSVG